MVSLDDIKSYMRSRIEEDQQRTFVNVSGDTLEDALQQAAIELNVPIKRIEYEILERGARGVMGMGKKPYLIIAYPAEKKAGAGELESEAEVDLSLLAGEEEKDRDGEVFVRLTPDGVMLKVTKPVGSGVRVTEQLAVGKLLDRTDAQFDKSRVARAVKLASGEAIKVGDFTYNPAEDAALQVEVTDDEMKAYLTAYPPGDGGSDPGYEQMISFLQDNDVLHGHLEEVLQRLEDEPTYRQSILVAEGTKPRNGADASVLYNFETSPGDVRFKEVDGKVDFKELNLLQNVVEGQVLAKKKPAERGEAGRTVTGRLLAAKDGADVAIPIGKNVKLSDDGNQALAEINGQVVIASGKITVEPVHVITGDVNLKTGNILFLGTVLVKGSVDDGFTVKAAGNIEVMGSVGKSELDAEGDIIVHQGINGKSSGRVRAGGSVWSRFIQNARVEAGELVVVSDGLINSDVLSDHKIVCKGKKANIVGGHLRAVEEINAKSLGSVGGKETDLEVGYDPKRKERLAQIDAEREELVVKIDELALNMKTVENFVRAGRKLSPEKKEYYEKLKTERQGLQKQVNALKEEGEEIRDYLAEIRVAGKISASGTVFPGVKVHIKDAFLEVRNEFKNVTFVSENDTVKVTKYEETSEDVTLGKRG